MTQNVTWPQMSGGFQEGNTISSYEFSEITLKRYPINWTLKDEAGDRKTKDLFRDY